MADCGSLNTITLRGAFFGNFMAHYDAARNPCQPTSRAFMCLRSLLQVTPETLAVANLHRYHALPASTSRIADPAPLKSASFISEYLREAMTPSAPPRNAANTASRVPSGVHLL